MSVVFNEQAGRPRQTTGASQRAESGNSWRVHRVLCLCGPSTRDTRLAFKQIVGSHEMTTTSQANNGPLYVYVCVSFFCVRQFGFHCRRATKSGRARLECLPSFVWFWGGFVVVVVVVVVVVYRTSTFTSTRVISRGCLSVGPNDRQLE